MSTTIPRTQAAKSGKTPAATPKGLGKGVSPAIDDITQRATVRQARERLDRIGEIRDAAHLAAAGLGQREIADRLRTTQPRVHRLLKAAQSVAVDHESPEEMILKATVEGLDRQTLLRTLTNATYTFKRHAPEPFDGALSGTWDQVRAAALAGFLTRDEYEVVRDAVNPPS